MKTHYISLFAVILFTCLSCVNTQNNRKHVATTDTSREDVKVIGSQEMPHLKFSFLGHKFDCSKDDLYREFEVMCERIPEVSFDQNAGSIWICGVGFHVNANETRCITLLSSVTAESDEIIPVRKLISKYHGESRYEEPYHYTWADENTVTSIRLRRVHSDEGGTVIFINTFKLSCETN